MSSMMIKPNGKGGFTVSGRACNGEKISASSINLKRAITTLLKKGEKISKEQNRATQNS